MHKITNIIIGVIGILAIGGLIYYFIRQTPNLPDTGIATETPAVTPLTPFAFSTPTDESAKKTALKLTVLSDEPIFDYWFASSTQEIFSVAENGKIVKITADKDIILSEQTAENLNYILPSPDGQKIIAAFGPANQPQFSIFDLVSNVWSPLPLEIKNLAWSPEGKRLVAVIEQNKQHDLIILNLEEKSKEKTPPVILKNFAFKDIKMEWPKPDEIILTQNSSFSAKTGAWRLGISKKTFSEIAAPGTGLSLKWLNENSGLKFQNQKLTLIDGQGKTVYDFSFLALPEKCLVAGELFYCFLFGAKKEVELPDDYRQKSFYSRDTLFKFDLKNPQTPQLLFDNRGRNIDAFHPRLLGSQILFINRYDDLLCGLTVE